MGEQKEEGIVLVSYQYPGIIYLSLHDLNSFESIDREIKSGIQLGPGSELILEGEIMNFKDRGRAAQLKGQINHEAARVYGICLLNPNGQGLSILAGTDLGNYSDAYPKWAQTLASSIRFQKPSQSVLRNGNGASLNKKEWDTLLRGFRLSYRSSYGSTGSGAGHASTIINIDLCPNGHFYYFESSNLTVSSYDGSAQGSSGE